MLPRIWNFRKYGRLECHTFRMAINEINLACMVKLYESFKVTIALLKTVCHVTE